ncbi:MAG TPA: hypothetical protein VMH22_10530 [bacterium]|nr:hypothetical protein [bacterium]
MTLRRTAFPFLILFLLLTFTARAGVVNPDISVIGQMRTFMTDDPADSNRNRIQMSLDETEAEFDAALNPFAHGTVILSVLDGGIDVEEAYLQIPHSLPLGLALKAGKYRVGFGKLNPAHPHTYPFIDRFRVLAAYLPGEESFDETGVQLSYRLPMPGDLSSTLSGDLLQGSTFHPQEASLSRPAWLGRWENFFMLGDESSMEMGLSATQGVNDVALDAKTSIFGADAKAKLWLTPLNVLVLQAEGLLLDKGFATLDSATGAVSRTTLLPFGGYAFADYTWKKKYDAGVKYERFQRPVAGKPWDQSIGLFAGFGLMEETTLFRFAWDRFFPGGAKSYNTYTVQILFSMGPHKAHQF